VKLMPVWLTVKEASKVLDVTEDAIRKRVKRGAMQVTLQDGIQRVLVSDQRIQADTTRQEMPETAKVLIESLRDQIRMLEDQNGKLFTQMEQLQVTANRTTAILDRILALGPGAMTQAQTIAAPDLAPAAAKVETVNATQPAPGSTTHAPPQPAAGPGRPLTIWERLTGRLGGKGVDRDVRDSD